MTLSYSVLVYKTDNIKIIRYYSDLDLFGTNENNAEI